MSVWPDRRILDLFGIDLPIIQAPMAGCVHAEMAIAVSEAGGLGSLPCALLYSGAGAGRGGDDPQGHVAADQPQFLLPHARTHDPTRSMAWRARLAPYYVEHGLDPEAPVPASNRAPFDDEFCGLVEDFRPEVVSFHFGLPDARIAGPGQSGRRQDHIVGDHRRGGALAGRVRLRRDHRHGL